MNAQRLAQFLFPVAPWAYSDGNNLRTIDLEIALQNWTPELTKPEAITDATKALRAKCLEKRVSEKAVKEILLKSSAPQIGSFLLKIDLEPVYVDTVLYLVKSMGGDTHEGGTGTRSGVNLGALALARHLQGWQTSTMQEDIQLCEFFLSSQKRTIVCNTVSEFASKMDFAKDFQQHEIERLFWLFQDQGWVDLKAPITRPKDNLMLLAQLTHYKIRVQK